MIPFWIKSALYSAEGALLGDVNVTMPQDGAGYLDRSPDGTSLIFATEVKQSTVSRQHTLAPAPAVRPVVWSARRLAGSGLHSNCN